MIFVDSHVHIHECFDVEFLLESALKNFRSAADTAVSSNKDVSFVLLLAERKSENWFKQIITKINTSGKNEIDLTESWIAAGNSNTSFKVEKSGCESTTIYIVGGVQTVTFEKIEVLGLCTHSDIADGLTLAETIALIEKAGGVAVLPWGAGKWVGARGTIVRKYLIENTSKKIYLGDNGGRPTAWPTPKIFLEESGKGLTVLPGSDPLPLQGEADRVASFGFYLDDSLSDNDDPTEYLKKMLISRQGEIVPYGNLLSNYRFIQNQIRVRLA